MKISVDSLTKQNIRFNFEKEIQRALLVIPEKDLYRLFEVRVEYNPPRHNIEAMGSYFGMREGAKDAYVLLYSKNIASCIPNSFSIFHNFAFRFYLTYALFHEIGHHRQRILHGVKKEEWENDAELYCKYMQTKNYKRNFAGKVIINLVLFVRGR
jgi:hypothetical protein